MAIDERNFRSPYYEKVGFKNVEEKRSLEILLKEKQLDLSKLRQFCLRFGIPVAYKNFIWKLLLGVLPIQEQCRAFVEEQRKEEFANLTHALEVMTINDKPDQNPSGNKSSYYYVALLLLQRGVFPYSYYYYKTDDEDSSVLCFNSETRALNAIVKSMMYFFDSEIDIYWITRSLYETLKGIECEFPKLIEATHALLEKEDLTTFQHLSSGEIRLLDALPMVEWFECCFAGIIHWSSLGKVWDRIAAGSYKILIYVTAVMLSSLGSKIQSCTTVDKILENVNNISEEMSEVIVSKSLDLWQQQGSPQTAYNKPKSS